MRRASLFLISFSFLLAAAPVIHAVNGALFSAPAGPFRGGGFYTATGDFNEDGILDLAGVVTGQDIASILLGNGLGAFGPEFSAPVGDQPFAAAAGDFNLDGHLDLAVTNRNDLSVLLGNGDGTFQPETRHDIGALIARFPLVADLDGDGDDDIAVAIRNPGVVAVLLGNGDGTFSPFVHFPAGVGRPRPITLGDFNEDGSPDLVIGSEGDSDLGLLPGRGDGSFGPTELLDLPGVPFNVITEDLNGDGHLDLVASTSFSSIHPDSVSVLLGNGDGSFGPFESYPTGTWPFGLTAGDFNLDGRNDVATADLITHNISLFLGVGNGTLIPQAPIPLALGLEQLLSEDVNGDGFEDLIGSVGGFVFLNRGIAPGTCADQDGDGFGSPGDTACAGGGAPDCDDLDPAVSPGAREICDGIDNDCDLGMDEGFDLDRDGITTCSGDCDDSNREILPGATEVCNFLDDDCDGLIDEVPEAAVSCDDSFPCSTDACDALAGCASNSSACTGSAVASSLYPEPVIHSGERPLTIAAGDLDGDGITDLVAANFGSGFLALPRGDFSVLLGNGDGAFPTEIRIPQGDSPNTVAIADFDSDGVNDLVSTNSRSGDVTVLFGNGDGTFRDGPRLGAGLFPTEVVAADLNGDGKPDLAVANAGSWDVSIFLGSGAGTFGPQSRFGTGPIPVDIAVGDLNLDGLPDLAVANDGGEGGGEVSILLGIGGGAFGPELRVSVGISPEAVVIGDFNSDGKNDLAVVLDLEDSISLVLGNGDGTFGPASRFETGFLPQDLTAVDLNADGHLDLAVATRADTVSVLLGDGAGGFEPRADFPVGSDPFSIIADDFNSDGHLDLATANFSGDSISVLLGAGDGSFPSGLGQLQTDSASFFVAVGDFNGDGIHDLAATNRGDLFNGVSSHVSVFLGLGGGAFGPPALFGVGINPQNIVVADFNADGNQDLAIPNNGLDFINIFGDASVLLGLGDGTFAPEIRLQAGNHPVFATAGDLNLDGHVDLVITNNDSPGDFSLFLGNGDGSFDPQVRVLTQGRPFSAVIGDFNNDRLPDVAVASLTGGFIPNITMRIGNGDGTFQPFRAVFGGDNPRSIAATDLDGDGNQDLVTADPSAVSVLLGTGTGFFDLASYGSNSVGLSVAVGDFNLDGIRDVAAAFVIRNQISVFPGQGDGTLAGQADFAAGTSPWSLAVGDFNADGRQDFAIANGFSDGVTLSINQGPFSGCLDADGDGFGFPANPVCPGGFVEDCDDANPDVFPGAPETCDLLDNDCDLAIDEGFDGDGDRCTLCNGDCDDANPAINPGALEVCDGIDNDCDGTFAVVLASSCDFQPSSFNVNSEGNSVSMHVTLTNLCTGDPLDPSLLGPAWVSRIGSPSRGDLVLGTPTAEPGCDDIFDDGIWDNPASRTVTGAGLAILRFDLPSDGQCETMDGDRQEFASLLNFVPDGEEASVCIKSTHTQTPGILECCGTTTVTNRGNR